MPGPNIFSSLCSVDKPFVLLAKIRRVPVSPSREFRPRLSTHPFFPGAWASNGKHPKFDGKMRKLQTVSPGFFFSLQHEMDNYQCPMLEKSGSFLLLDILLFPTNLPSLLNAHLFHFKALSFTNKHVLPHVLPDC